jgi:hypothetical protein
VACRAERRSYSWAFHSVIALGLRLGEKSADWGGSVGF